MRKLKAGVIGTGWVATARHIPALRRLDNVEVAAVYDRDEARARAVASKFNIPIATSSIDDLLTQAGDFVSICTPPTSHADLAIRALSAGRHVFIEKPMAMNPAEAQAMVDVADRTGRQLCVSHNLLYSRSVRSALKELETAGPIQHIMATQFSNPRRRLPVWYEGLPGGLFFDESPHVLYLIRRLLGEVKVDMVRSRLDTSNGNAIDGSNGNAIDGSSGNAIDGSSGNAIDFIETRLTNGEVDATVTMSFNAPVSEWRVTILATHKVISLDLFRDIITVTTNDGRHGPAEVLTGSLGTGFQSVKGFVSSGALYSMNKLLYGHEGIIAAFVDSIGGAPNPVQPAEALSVVRVTQDILRRAGIVTAAPERERIRPAIAVPAPALPVWEPDSQRAAA